MFSSLHSPSTGSMMMAQPGSSPGGGTSRSSPSPSAAVTGDCPDSFFCTDFHCGMRHPSERTPKCPAGGGQSNAVSCCDAHCSFLHPVVHVRWAGAPHNSIASNLLLPTAGKIDAVEGGHAVEVCQKGAAGCLAGEMCRKLHLIDTNGDGDAMILQNSESAYINADATSISKSDSNKHGDGMAVARTVSENLFRTTSTSSSSSTAAGNNKAAPVPVCVICQDPAKVLASTAPAKKKKRSQNDDDDDDNVSDDENELKIRQDLRFMGVLCSPAGASTASSSSSTSCHYTCARCLSSYVTTTWTSKQHEPGIVPELTCPGVGCKAVFHDRQVAKFASEEALDAYFSLRQKARDAMAFAQAHALIASTLRSAGDAEKKKLEKQLLQEQLQRQFPKALMCSRCDFGPLTSIACSSLDTHHGDPAERFPTVAAPARPAAAGFFGLNPRPAGAPQPAATAFAPTPAPFFGGGGGGTAPTGAATASSFAWTGALPTNNNNNNNNNNNHNNISAAAPTAFWFGTAAAAPQLANATATPAAAAAAPAADPFGTAAAASPAISSNWASTQRVNTPSTPATATTTQAAPAASGPAPRFVPSRTAKIDNRCPHCKHMAKDTSELRLWDGVLREAHELRAKEGEFEKPSWAAPVPAAAAAAAPNVRFGFAAAAPRPAAAAGLFAAPAAAPRSVPQGTPEWEAAVRNVSAITALSHTEAGDLLRRHGGDSAAAVNAFFDGRNSPAGRLAAMSSPTSAPQPQPAQPALAQQPVFAGFSQRQQPTQPQQQPRSPFGGWDSFGGPQHTTQGSAPASSGSGNNGRIDRWVDLSQPSRTGGFSGWNQTVTNTATAVPRPQVAAPVRGGWNSPAAAAAETGTRTAAGPFSANNFVNNQSESRTGGAWGQPSSAPAQTSGGGWGAAPRSNSESHQPGSFAPPSRSFGASTFSASSAASPASASSFSPTFGSGFSQQQQQQQQQSGSGGWNSPARPNPALSNPFGNISRTNGNDGERPRSSRWKY